MGHGSGPRAWHCIHPAASGETEEAIRADEKAWDRQFAESRHALRTIAREAAAEYRAGRTKPMEFTPLRVGSQARLTV